MKIEDPKFNPLVIQEYNIEDFVEMVQEKPGLLKILDPDKIKLIGNFHFNLNLNIPGISPFLLKNPKWAYWYAYEVIKGRWEEAEPFIIKDPQYAYRYSRNIIKGRFKEAEPFFMKDPHEAYMYAKYIKIVTNPEECSE